MYGLFWRVLPGPWWVKLTLYIVVIAAVLFVLASTVFPWVQQTYFAPIDVTTNGGNPAG